MKSIELINVNKQFGSGSSLVKVLKDVNLYAEKGEVVLILGPSGSGKSTLLTIAGGIQTPSSGKIILDGSDITNLSTKKLESIRLNKIGFILQSYNLVPYLNVRDQFALADKVKKHGNLSRDELINILKQLQINTLVDKYPSELSGGQNQRVAIARALYTDPEIILADEPTASLDTSKVDEVGKLLSMLSKKRQKTIIIVTHDIRLQKYADRVYQLSDGKININN